MGSSAKCLLLGASLGRVASQAAGQVEVCGSKMLPRYAQSSGGHPATLVYVHWQGGETVLLGRTVLLQSAVQLSTAQSVCQQFWGGVGVGIGSWVDLFALCSKTLLATVCNDGL